MKDFGAPVGRGFKNFSMQGRLSAVREKSLKAYFHDAFTGIGAAAPCPRQPFYKKARSKLHRKFLILASLGIF